MDEAKNLANKILNSMIVNGISENKRMVNLSLNKEVLDSVIGSLDWQGGEKMNDTMLDEITEAMEE